MFNIYRPITICIGLRYFFAKKTKRTDRCIAYISIISMALGIMALITTLSIMNGFEKELEEKLLKFIPHVLLTSQIGKINSQEDTSYLKKLKGIKQITTIVTSDIILQSKKNISIGTMIGINPTSFEPLKYFISHGSLTQLIPQKYHIIISETLANQLKIQIGDNIRLILPNILKNTPLGNIPRQRLFKITGIYITNTDVDNYQVLINQEDAARLMHYPPKYITGWRIWLQKPLQINHFLNTQNFPDKIVKKDWRERQGNIFSAIKMEKNIMGLLLGSIILMSGLNIINFSFLLITEKKKKLLF